MTEQEQAIWDRRHEATDRAIEYMKRQITNAESGKKKTRGENADNSD